MKTTTVTTTLYSFDELSEEAQDHVIERIANYADLDFVYDGIQESLKKICEQMNFRIDDYAYGPSCRNHKLKISGHLEDWEGKKALVRFTHTLEKHGYTRPKTFAGMKFPGVCGFTGWCYDDMICEKIWEHLMDGNSFRDSFDMVASDLCNYCEKELQYLQSKECILEGLDTSEEIYTENGEVF